eukprot:TRINITY_DN12353_c0_g1_i1.p1 TRINITY_DN12353_c0_g1~~TRINITY_DN12353_c0_g1_i1.p1  ORF type:complete len:159 (-),score=22.49 TRINITY_DN12353_c0_g1_i1:126-602(-)
MAAASEVMGVMNVEGLNCEVRVRNTFIHVGERPLNRQMSAPGKLAVLNLDIAIPGDVSDGKVYSLDDYVSDAEACDGTFHGSCDERSRSLTTPSNSDEHFSARDMQDGVLDASDESDAQERDTIACDKVSAPEAWVHSMVRLHESDGSNSLVDGRIRM